MASTLNPHAEPFVPFFCGEVDDFSAKWWRLVKSSPWFRDFWLRERFNQEKLEDLVSIDPEHAGMLSADAQQKHEKTKKRINERMELMAWGAEKWMETRCRPSDVRRCLEKAHKFVSPRVSPRTIQQPR